MYRNLLSRHPVVLAVTSICALLLVAASVAPVSWAQNSTTQYPPGQYPPGQYPPGTNPPGIYPPGRPAPIAAQCQAALVDRISADARRRVSLSLDTQIPYSVSSDRQGLRGRVRYGIGGPNTWRTANYDCLVNLGRNRVDRLSYTPRANSTGWPGEPGYPGGPGYPGVPPGPGIPNYPRVRVDTSGRGTYNSRAAGSVRITRGFVDSTGPRPSVSLRGGNFMITFYGMVVRSDGRGFTMQITGSDRGPAQGTAQARLNNDRNEVETITLNGNLGRDNFTGNFGR